MSITFTPLSKLALPDNLVSRILITQQASHKSVVSLKGKMADLDCQHSLNWAMQLIDVLSTFNFFADDAHLDNLRKSTRNIP